MISSLGIIYLVVETAAALMLSYAAFWAFSIGQALAVRLYRNQARGIGFMSVSLLFFSVWTAALIYIVPTHANIGPPENFGLLAFLVIFYWIDATVLAGRRSDPLLRDVLYWRRLRFFFWAGMILSLVFLVSVGAYFGYLLATGALVIPSGCAPPPPSAIPLILAPLLLTGVAGFVYLPIVARRSGDVNLRRSLRWFWLFAASLIVSLLAVSAVIAGPLCDVEYVGSIILGLGNLAGGYFLYRSAKALFPLNKLPDR